MVQYGPVEVARHRTVPVLWHEVCGPVRCRLAPHEYDDHASTYPYSKDLLERWSTR